MSPGPPEPHLLAQTLVDSTPDFIYMKNTRGQYVYVNAAMSRQSGQTAAEILGKDDFAFFPAKFARQIQVEDQAVLASGETRTHEESLDVDGKILHFLTIKSVVKDAAGKVIGLVGISRNITERKQAEEALQQSEAQLRAAFDHAPFEFWVRDKAGRCIMQNAALIRRWGSILGKQVEDTSVSEESRAIWKENNRRAYAGEIVRGEVAYTEQETTRHYHNVVAPFRIGDEICGILGFNIDITEHKQAESALRDLTQQLLQSQDEERRRIARELHDSTTQDLVGVLLTLVTLKKRLSATDAENARLLEECIETARRNIKDLRTLSFLLHPPHLEHFGLIGAIRDLADEFGRRSGIRISLGLSEQMTRLPMDHELALYRILQEALLNIHRHAKSKTAAIRLVPGHEEIRLEVEDAGQGLPAKVLSGEGGVGISGMRERLRYLGGRLEIRTSSQGTTIMAILPTPKSERPSSPVQQPKKAIPIEKKRAKSLRKP